MWWTLFVQSAAAIGQRQKVACPREDRYCRDGDFWTEFEFECFEGNLPTQHVGVYFKEYSSAADHQLWLSDTLQTSEVLRINKIWQLPDVYKEDPSVEPTEQQFAYQTSREWFAGDVVPFGNCAYVVNIGTEQLRSTVNLSDELTEAELIDNFDPVAFYTGNREVITKTTTSLKKTITIDQITTKTKAIKNQRRV